MVGTYFIVENLGEGFFLFLKGRQGLFWELEKVGRINLGDLRVFYLEALFGDIGARMDIFVFFWLLNFFSGPTNLENLAWVPNKLCPLPNQSSFVHLRINSVAQPVQTT